MILKKTNYAIYCLLFLFNCLLLKGQENVTISGYIKDADNAETLIGANVFAKSLNIGTVTNLYGYYAFKVPKSETELSLTITYIGYENLETIVKPSQNVSLSLDLQPESEVLNEIVVTEDVNQQLIEKTQMGTQKITSKSLKAIPVMFGEADILKVLQLTAGVQTGAEGTSGFYVRGGGQDQNLILLDEATVYNPEHFFGFFSTFNADIIKNMQIYKSDFPSQYGGRLSSVLDVQMKEGNLKEFGGQGGIGLIASRFTVEGPLQKNRSSFILSGRRTYLDLFEPIINKQLPEDSQMPDYFFYDLNAKMNYIINDKNRIYVSGYFGRDKLAFTFDPDAENSSTYDLQWGNMTGTLRWNRIINPSLFSNTSFVVSRFKYNDRFNFGDFFEFKSASKTYTLSLKQDFDYYLNNEHHLKFGANYTHHIIQPVNFSAGTTTTDTLLQADTFGEKQQYLGEEMAIYVQDDWKINSRFSMKIGLRYSAFITSGNKYLHALEPRFAFNYQINSQTAVKASYARMAQYLHQVKYSYLSFLDPWFPSNQYMRPQLSDQVSVGFSRLVFDNNISINNEYYYKWLQNQLEYKNGAAFLFADENYHERLAEGDGWGYGTEIQIEKPKGRLTGWLAYTLSWSYRKFDDLNNGEAFPFTYDRRHLFNAVVQYQLGRNWSFSANWTYRTGVAFDLPSARFLVFGLNYVEPDVVPIYGKQNAFRMPAYHRLDMGFVKKFKPKKYLESELALSIYNVYSRRNPFFVYPDEEVTNSETGEYKFVYKQASLFPILPSVSYNFKF